MLSESLLPIRRHSASWGLDFQDHLASNSSSISGPPRLPFDIFLEVLGHLRISLGEDRKTLLALALSCRDLRNASQRVLFSSMCCNGPTTDFNRTVCTLNVHSKFLRVIVDSPNRLALYVRSYSKNALALDPNLSTTGMGLRTF